MSLSDLEILAKSCQEDTSGKLDLPTKKYCVIILIYFLI
jgi:hypothetical protein